MDRDRKARVQSEARSILGQGPRILIQILSVAALVALQMALPPAARADPGDLDPSFGTGSKVTTDFAGSSDAAYATALQWNGKIVVAGSGVSAVGVGTTADFVLARYDLDGTLDPSFGRGGRVRTDFAGSFDAANALALQGDGKIVAAGVTYSGKGASADFALVRYNPDGSLDPSFGHGGKVRTDFAGPGDAYDTAYGLALQWDGKIVVAGIANRNAGDFALARYNPDGTLDPSFGHGGKVSTDFADDSDYVIALALQGNGKIVAAGTAVTGENSDFALARYNLDGTLDPSFGHGGKVTTDFPGSDSDSATALALQGNGKIVAAGGTFSNFALARYNLDGTLDTSFGTEGKVTTDFPGSSVARALAVQGNGKLVAAGMAHTGVSLDFALARYNLDGTLDPSFGHGGTVSTGFGTGSDRAFALALQGNGKIVAAGSTGDFPHEDFALARYL